MSVHVEAELLRLQDVVEEAQEDLAELKGVLSKAVEVIEAVLPQIRGVAPQEYGRLNLVLVRSKLLLQEG